MDAPPQLYAAWELQHAAAERSRVMAEEITKRRLDAAKARVAAALRALEVTARIDSPPT